jgi:hypothetical protein
MKTIKALAVPIGIAISFFMLGYYYSKHEVVTKALENKKICYDLEDIILITN